jgi:glutaredoxin
MILVELFSKKECHLCEEAKGVIEKVRQEIPFSLREIELHAGDPYYEEYKEMVPVVHINRVQAFKFRVNENMLRVILRRAAAEERQRR